MSFFHGRIELKDTKNCFVTLPAKWVKQNFRPNSYGLIIIKLIFLDDIKPDKFIYVTWNGSKNCTEDSIFLDRNFATKSNIIDNELILVQMIDDLSRISTCISCYLKPLSDDDHQIITINSEEIEYKLLNQIRILTIAFLKNDEFNIVPIWLSSSPNVPIFVKIFRVEPTNKTGLIITQNTKIVIVPMNETKFENESTNDIIAPVIPSSSNSATLKSVFGLFKSLVPSKDNIFPIAHTSHNDCFDKNVDQMKHVSFHIYQGKSLFLRVILAKNIDPFNVSIAFISPKHFEYLNQSDCNEKQCLIRLKKFDHPLHKASDIDPISYDTTSMSTNEKFCTTFIDKYLKIYDYVNELNILAKANDDCPEDSIMLSQSFIVQYSLPFLSYIILDHPDLNVQNADLEKKNNIEYLKIPIARKIFAVPLLPQYFNGENELIKMIQKSKNNNIMVICNGFINDEKYFLIKHQQQLPVPDFDVEIFKFLSSCFLIDQSTEIIVQQVTSINSSMLSHMNKLSKKRQTINDMIENYKNIGAKAFAGRDETIKECIRFIDQSLNLNSKSFDTNLFTAMLVAGSKGSGKTTLIERILYDCFNNHYIWNTIVRCSNVKGKRIESIQKSWSKLFTEAVHHQPSIIIFEDLHQIVYETGDDETKNVKETFDNNSGDNSHTKSSTPESFYCERVSHIFCQLIDSLRKFKSLSKFSRITIIATAESYLCLNKVIKQFNVFDQVIDIHQLNGRQRIQILNDIFRKKYDTLSSKGCSTTTTTTTTMKTSLNVDMKLLSKMTKNFTVQQLDSLVDMSIHCALVDSLRKKDNTKIQVNIDDEHVQQAFTKLNFHLIKKNDLKLNTKRMLKDVGGMSNVKEILSDLILLQIRHPNLHRYLPLKLPNSLLIYGMPGCGKTAIIEAIANEANINFLSVKGPELLSKYIGNSEQSVRRIFRQAENSSPCILFFDEFDSLAPRRGHDSTGVTDRVVNQILTLMDGLEERKQNIFIIAATSRPDLIDLSLLRPGRFDQIVYCQLPDENERKEIFMVLGQKLSINFDMILFNQIVKSTENFTGADIQALLYNAFLDATKQAIDDLKQNSIHHQQQQSQQNNNNKVQIEWANIQHAMNITRPSLSEQERTRFIRIYNKFEAELSGKFSSMDMDKLSTNQARITLA
ncbi:uncharacterized protein LOC113790327 [Dermatophagoides pteronyssinus]|uniref:uncharacterized protein LOC113790327 n=1 Tax=Dermatophagoides pteronyssinus TaxID=6956 RepID=UPI003F66BB29